MSHPNPMWSYKHAAVTFDYMEKVEIYSQHDKDHWMRFKKNVYLLSNTIKLNNLLVTSRQGQAISKTFAVMFLPISKA